MLITPVPCLKDNYAYIVNDNISKKVGVVDPSEAKPIIDLLERMNLKLDFIFNTHHHFDHVGGNSELKKKYKAKVVGFNGDKHRIPDIDITVKDEEVFKFGNSIIKIIHIPGHTSGHICFFFEKEKIAFTGDTLFSLGCGRIFEGDYKQMLASLNKIKKLPEDTKIYCGHEYTFNNGKFCMEQDKGNIDLIKKFEEIKILRSKNLPTIPTILKDELKSNIFLRCDENALKIKLNMENIEDYKVFKKVRDLKDVF
jgi:hydroxyacylglutathione hydrolase